MTFSAILWILIWGGMYTGPYNITPDMFSNFGTFFQGGRAFLPIVVLYICLFWMILFRLKLPSFSNSHGLFFYYAMVGLVISLFSPDVMVALYWGGVYLSPIILLGIVADRDYSLRSLRFIAIINYCISLAVVLSLILQNAQWEMSSQGRIVVFDLPFGLGIIKGNGVARFALIVLIFSLVRFMSNKRITRYLFAIPAVPALLLLMQTQSRTALLGLAIGGVILVTSLGLKWQFLFIGPGIAYLIYRVGFEWRARADVSLIVNLTGRDFTWNKALEMVGQSPILGWGFHADRLLLDSQHMHNSYLHALIHSGAIGLAFFIAAIASIWYFIFKKRIFRKLKNASPAFKPYLIESLLILGALTARTFFESTAAFFGVDLLFFLSAAVFIYVWGKQQIAEENR